MKKIEIYTTMFCPFCSRAKKLLAIKGVEFTEIDVTIDAPKRQEMIDRAKGAYTVPQIFVDGAHIGDCNRLYDLDASGKLDPILNVA